jgi:uncharacterized protein GlcG (DUF336 family)
MIRTPRLSLEHANAMICAALHEAVTRGLKPVSAAVLDAGGHLVAFQRQDHSPNLHPQMAIAKASGALGFGVSSRKLGQIAAERPSFVTWLSAIAPHGILPAAGGVLLADEQQNVIGAVAVTGDTADNDEACALAGINAVGLTALM